MPRFFFDLDDGVRSDIDDTGLELADVQQAQREAVGVLPAIAMDLPPGRDQRDLVAVVRDAGGHPVFRATLSLKAEWLDGVA